MIFSMQWTLHLFVKLQVVKWILTLLLKKLKSAVRMTGYVALMALE